MIRTILLLLLGILTLTACEAPPPTALPPTRIPATPISTELPPVATDIPAGFNTQNPIRIAWMADIADETVQALATDLSEQLTDLSGIAVEFVPVSSTSDALGLLCDSNQSNVTGAWLDALAFIAADFQDCGEPTLRSQRGSVDDPDDGKASALLLHRAPVEDDADEDEIEEPSISAVTEEEGSFCRVAVDDFYSWTAPVMLLSIEGIAPEQITDIDEFDDYDALIAAVADGTCSAAGVPESIWQAAIDNDETLEETVVLVNTSAAFPYGVMVFPPAASLQAIQTISDALILLDVAYGRSELILDPEATQEPDATPIPEIETLGEAEALDSVFGTGRLVKVDAGHFEDLLRFLDDTGFDFARIGD